MTSQSTSSTCQHHRHLRRTTAQWDHNRHHPRVNIIGIWEELQHNDITIDIIHVSRTTTQWHHNRHHPRVNIIGIWEGLQHNEITISIIHGSCLPFSFNNLPRINIATAYLDSRKTTKHAISCIFTAVL